MATYWISMPNAGQDGVVVVRRGTDRVEFRGPPYSEWQDNQQTTTSPFYEIHSALEGWHVSPLHAGADEVAILPSHPEYESIAKMFGCAEPV